MKHSKLKKAIREEVKRQLNEDFVVPVGRGGFREVRISDPVDPGARRDGYVCKLSVSGGESYLTRSQVHDVLDYLEQHA